MSDPAQPLQVDLRKSRTKWAKATLLKRVAWNVLGQPWLLVLPRPLHRINSYILRLFGANLGKKCLVMPGVRVLMPWNLTVGDYCAIGRDAEIYNFAPVTIGNMAVISQYVFLCTGTHDFTDSAMPLTYKPISIGSHSWVAAGAFVGPGVVIGEGAVVGARSTVAKDVPPWTVVAGSPARVLKRREILR